MSLVFQNIDPPTPSPPCEFVLPPNKGGGYTLAGRRGGWGSIFWKTRDIGLPSYSNNLSTGLPILLQEKICGPILGIYKSLKDICMWELRLKPRNAFFGKT
jgi:hypothetical protein